MPQTLSINAPSGLTFAVEIYAINGSSQIAGSPFTATELPKKTVYTLDIETPVIGKHQIVIKDGATPIGAGYVNFLTGDGVFHAVSELSQLGDGAVDNSAFSLPVDSAGAAGNGVLTMIRRIYQRLLNRRTRNNITGQVVVYMDDSATPAVSYTQSSTSTTDTTTRAV